MRPLADLRIVIDGSKCDGRGMCALVLPELISPDTWGYASLEKRPIEDSRTLARARRAVHACPAGALALVGPGGAAVSLRRARVRRASAPGA